jgi:hypothetical protein
VSSRRRGPRRREDMLPALAPRVRASVLSLVNRPRGAGAGSISLTVRELPAVGDSPFAKTGRLGNRSEAPQDGECAACRQDSEAELLKFTELYLQSRAYRRLVLICGFLFLAM